MIKTQRIELIVILFKFATEIMCQCGNLLMTRIPWDNLIVHELESECMGTLFCIAGWYMGMLAH